MGTMTSLHLGSRSLSFAYIGSTPKIQSVAGRMGDFHPPPGKLGKCVWDNFQGIAGSQDAYDLTTHNCQITINQTVTYCKCRGVK
jgi:hypothetical protein